MRILGLRYTKLNVLNEIASRRWSWFLNQDWLWISHILNRSSYLFFFFLVFIWLLQGSQHVGSSPLQGLNPSLLHWECRVLATGPPRKFPGSSYLLIKSWKKISSSVYDCWHGWSEIKVAHGLYSLGFSRSEYWSGYHSLLQGLNPGLPHCGWILHLLNHQESRQGY